MRHDDVMKKTEAGIKESNKILIKELIQDLVEKGIKPVIAINGEVKRLQLVSWDEQRQLEEFLGSSEFCFLEQDTDYKHISNDLKTDLFVVHKISGKMKKYRRFNDDAWIKSFQDDINNNFFND